MLEKTESESKMVAHAEEHPFAKHVTGDLLNLSRMNLVDKDIKDILRFLQNNLQITRLNLSLNHIGDLGLSDFSERNHSILQLDFSGNNISDIGLAVFGYKNQVVIRANFSHNRISDIGIMSFAEKNHYCVYSQFSAIRYH